MALSTDLQNAITTMQTALTNQQNTFETAINATTATNKASLELEQANFENSINDKLDIINSRLNTSFTNTNLTANENARLSAETIRLSNEVTRKANETNRINAENIRVSSFNTIKNDYQNATQQNTNIEVVSARKGEVNLGARLDKVDTSLADMATNVKNFGAKGDGLTDDTVAIQNAISSAGTGKIVVFEKGKEYNVSSTIYVPVGVILEFNFATITPITGGTFVNNYVFSLNSSNVSTWDEQYPYKFVGINRLVSDNKNLITNLKLFFVACPIRTEDIYSRRYYGTIKTPSVYVDLFDINYIMVVDHMSATNYAIEKVGQGDAVSIKGVHCVNYLTEGVYLKGVSVSGSLGCTIESCLNGDYKINNCEATSINNSHFEKGVIILQDSNVTINGGYFWKKTAEACIVIIDSQLQYSGQINRPVTLNDVVFKLKYQMYDYNVDFEEIDISSFGGELILNNVFREAESYGMPYAYAYNCGVALKTGVGTSIITNSNVVTIKNKTIKNDKIINGANDDGYYYASGVSAYENANINFKAPLTTYYYKVSSILDKSRMIGIVNNSNEKSLIIPNLNSYAKLVFGSSVMHLPMIRIYRGTSTGTYDKYVDIPYPMSRSLFDTGADVNGFVWKDRASGTYDTLNASYSFQFNSVNITSYGTGIPTVGTWVKGDRIINVNPSAGGYTGWICIESGTSGTWKGFGVIEV